MGTVAVTSFLVLVVLVHLDDVEDEANDGDDQQTQLNGVRERYHKLSPPFRQNGGAKEAPSVPVSTGGKNTPLAVYRQHPYYIGYHNRQKMTSP